MEQEILHRNRLEFDTPKSTGHSAAKLDDNTDALIAHQLRRELASYTSAEEALRSGSQHKNPSNSLKLYGYSEARVSIEKRAFVKLVHEIVVDLSPPDVDYRITSSGLSALQVSAGAYLVDLFERANYLAINSRHDIEGTVWALDIRNVRMVREENSLSRDID